MLNDYLAKESSLQQLTYSTNEVLAPHSTFGIGGQCDFFVKPITEGALISLLSFLKKHRIPYFIMGNGSNLLFDDDGFRGCIISTKELKEMHLEQNEIEVACGYSLIALSSFAQKNGLSGLEFACSIPATVGGAIYMNAGAYGGQMQDVITTVRYLNENGNIATAYDHGFSYRHSIYQAKELTVLSCKIRLKSDASDQILARMLENKEKRKTTQPIAEKSAGSVFRREEGIIPAKLIDEAGLKGFSIGGASVSTKHAGFIINHNNATSKDVLTLIDQIKTIVWERYGVKLVSEIRYLPSHK